MRINTQGYHALRHPWAGGSLNTLRRGSVSQVTLQCSSCGALRHTHTLSTRWVPVAGVPPHGTEPHSCICIQLSSEQNSSSGVHHASPSTSSVTWFPSHLCIQLAGEMVTLGMWVPIIQRRLGCRAHWPQHHSRHTSQEADADAAPQMSDCRDLDCSHGASPGGLPPSALRLTKGCW